MPKQPLFESFRHQFLLTIRAMADIEHVLSPQTHTAWYDFIQSLVFNPVNSQTIRISWQSDKPGSADISTEGLLWYYRGDTLADVKKQKSAHLPWGKDVIQRKNQMKFWHIVSGVVKRAGFQLSKGNTFEKQFDAHLMKHFADEEKLFDEWAKHADVTHIDVMKMSEACTAPEMRFITKTLGNLQGKTLLDVGCGLGEASVYFARKGARVSALDLSHEMLLATQNLARHNGVQVTTIHAAIEHLHIPKGKKFDIIYAGNLFHHVHIPSALAQLTPHLAEGGKLICWEPVSYNPVINIYRNMAHEVRSHDERPIRMSDIAVFRRYFKSVETKWFWLTTLIIFVTMILLMRRNPNKTRLWKKVVEEADTWAPLYIPLEILDRTLLALFPILGPLCWNVVISCSKPKSIRYV